MDFSLETLTAAISELPFLPTQLGASGLFEYDGVSTLTVQIEKDTDGTLALVPSAARGAPGVSIGRSSRSGKPFNLAHLPISDTVWADEVQGVRAFGTEAEAASFETELIKVMQKGKNKLNFTLENMRVGAIKGIVLDADGSVLVNLLTEFGVTQPSIAIDLSSATTDVRGKINLITDSIDEALKTASAPQSFDGWINPDAFRALINHKAVKDSYLAQAEAAQLRSALPDTFDYGGVTWRKYRGRGATSIESGKAYVVPRSPGMFIGRFGPANYRDTVNTKGLPIYAMGIERRNNTGVDIEMQSNPFHACTRPDAVMRVDFTLPT